ncbi:flagellar FlbD family protein [Halobacillus sp. Nhm2S1]|uniref:flagellar FlbD family protein n=1 Tax=Halobacillus sp. Nhm2S1 TaxID=2866716 RepID=UPI001C73AF01|nr:flagellar FlbD family protein [Halobacillus sp. Nhm2S1]MBX0356439.1 flagellar FlbD family protein [Halobacillus sp. Nhm2S1]
MITLTKLNGQPFTFNAIYIEQIQSNPDTTVITTTGRTFLVKESEQQVLEKVTSFYKEIGIVRVSDKAGEDK